MVLHVGSNMTQVMEQPETSSSYWTCGWSGITLTHLLLVCISIPTPPSFLFTAHKRLSLLSLSFCSLSDIPLSNLLIQRANRTIITQIKVINSLQRSSFSCLSSTSYHQTLPLFQSQLFSLLSMPLKDTVPEEHFKSNKQLSSERESRAQATLKAHQRPE